MKRIQDIEKLSAIELERIGADESIPVPADWHPVLPRRRGVAVWSAAAAVAVLIGFGWFGFKYEPAPKDTFDDPYLAYAAIEQTMAKMSVGVNQAVIKVTEAEQRMDQIYYRK